jgi:cation transport protein ChaC
MAGHETIDCHCFVVDILHPQYAGNLSTEIKLEMIANASGSAGENKDYLLNTADHLSNINIQDHYIEEIANKFRQWRDLT